MSDAIPGPGTWVFDTSHSSVEFVARHLTISKVRGGFSAFSGTVTVAEPVTDSAVDVTIETASFSSGDENRDGHVRGELTIRDVTRPVELAVEALGVIADPWGNEKAAFSATTEIDREDFGVTWNAALETGGVLVGSKVRIEIDVQLGREG